MPLYTARLESTVDDQWRRRTLEAADEKQARKLFEQLEHERASYSLTARAPVQQIVTRRHAEGVHATVNMDLFAGSGLGGHDLLAYCEREHAIDADGKAYGPNKHVKAHLQAHYQREPYRIASLEPLIPSTSQIILALKQLREHPEEWDRALKRMHEDGIHLNAVTGSLYGLTSQHMIDGSAPIVWSSATMDVALTTSSYAPNNDTDDFFNDVTNEVTGTGYTAKGATLGSKTSTYDTATDQIRLDAADTSWTTSTITARIAVLWNDTAGASSTDPVVGWVNFGADVSTTAGTFAITWDSTGLVVYDVT
jgi:hypothetical protein